MSNEFVVGQVGWSPDFQSVDVRTEQLRKIVDEGRLKLVPRDAPNRALVAIDVIAVEVMEDAPTQADLGPDSPPEWDPGTLLASDASQQVEFTYTNWKGVTKQRRAIMRRLYKGSTEYHKEPQWLIEGFDMDKEALRTYAMNDISNVRMI